MRCRGRSDDEHIRAQACHSDVVCDVLQGEYKMQGIEYDLQRSVQPAGKIEGPADVAGSYSAGLKIAHL